jgi:proteasome lid subunit RPN8/RPN11
MEESRATVPRITIRSHVPRRFTEAIRGNPHVQVGGEYIGIIRGPDDSENSTRSDGSFSDYTVEVLDSIEGGPRARRTATVHLADEQWQAEELVRRKAHDSRVEVVGSWHSHHPNVLHDLSAGDIEMFRRAVNSPEYLFDHFFVSLGIDRRGFESARHFMFMRGVVQHIEVSASEIKIIDAGRYSTSEGVFISYRRSDQPAFAGRLYDKLSAEFGQDRVFMDVASGNLGLDFRVTMEQMLAICRVVLVVIGPQWLTTADDDGRLRIHQQDDYVRLEVQKALDRGVPVIPVLVDGASMPRADELPTSIAELAFRNGREVGNAHFNSDCLDLIGALERIIGA